MELELELVGLVCKYKDDWMDFCNNTTTNDVRLRRSCWDLCTTKLCFEDFHYGALCRASRNGDSR